MNKIKTRRTTNKDANLVAPLFDSYRQFYGQKADLKLAKKFISDRLKNKQSIIFIAFLEQQAVGFVQLYPSFSSVAAQKILVLNDLYVAAEARKLGAAKALMNRAKDYALKNKFKRLSLATAKNNLTAQSLYQSLGYKIDQNYDHYSLEITKN
ncbi:MAG: GNAT family N-acetyltransferase [Pseudomonadota bacterium]